MAEPLTDAQRMARIADLYRQLQKAKNGSKRYEQLVKLIRAETDVLNETDAKDQK